MADNYQQAIIKVVTDATAVTDTGSASQATEGTGPYTINSASLQTWVYGIQTDYPNQKISFEYSASVMYTDSNKVTYQAFGKGSVNGKSLIDLCDSTGAVPVVTITSATAATNTAGTEVDFTINYSIAYKSCQETLMMVDMVNP
jgi:hypothetical protein